MSVSFDKLRAQIKSRSDDSSEDAEPRFGRNKVLDKDDYFIRLSEAQRMMNEARSTGTVQVNNEEVKHMMSTIENQNKTINQHIQKINELENYIKQLTGITKQHEAKIVEHNNFLNKYSSTLQFNKNELDEEQLFAIDILEKYSEYTGNQSDGFKASTLGVLVELESEGEISKGRVKGIMESIHPARDKGPGSCKQEKMFGGYPHYRGFRPKAIVSNIADDRESLRQLVASQTQMPQVNVPQSSRNVTNKLPQVTGSMSPSQSPMYNNGALSPAPVMIKQQL